MTVSILIRKYIYKCHFFLFIFYFDDEDCDCRGHFFILFIYLFILFLNKKINKQIFLFKNRIKHIICIFN
jgi:hypothetical protein